MITYLVENSSHWMCAFAVAVSWHSGFMSHEEPVSSFPLHAKQHSHVPNPCQLFPLPRCAALCVVSINIVSHLLTLPVSAQVPHHGKALLSATIPLSQSIYFSCWHRSAENSFGSLIPLGPCFQLIPILT